MAALDESPPASAAERPLDGTAALMAALGIMLVAANLRPAVVSVSPLIDTISDSFGFSSSTAGLLTTLPVLFFGIAAPVAPRLAHRFGIERTIFASLAVLVAGIALRLVPSAGALFGGSVLIGAGIGVCNVVLPALIKRDFAHRSGLMTGLYSMTLSGGAARRGRADRADRPRARRGLAADPGRLGSARRGLDGAVAAAVAAGAHGGRDQAVQRRLAGPHGLGHHDLHGMPVADFYTSAHGCRSS